MTTYLRAVARRRPRFDQRQRWHAIRPNTGGIRAMCGATLLRFSSHVSAGVFAPDPDACRECIKRVRAGKPRERLR